MDHLSIDVLLFLIGAGFVAAFIDSVVGGGGLISLPALLFAGLPPGIALGTNKLAGTLSSFTSSLSFLISGKVRLRFVFPLFPFSFIGSAVGSYCITQIPSEFLKPLVVALLVLIALYTLGKKGRGSLYGSGYRGMSLITAAAAALIAGAIGFYDGFFGPGTGSFLIFALLLLGFDFVGAAGNAKVLNFASNIASLATFLLLDSVNFTYGLPMAGAMILGAAIGSQVAIRKGNAYIKPLFVIITILLIGRQIWELV